MTNIAYPKWREAEKTAAAPNLLTSDVKAVVVDTGAYTYSAAHQYLSDIPGGARAATSGNMTGKAILASGAFDCDNFDVTFGGSPPSVEALVFYVDTGVEATSRLITYDDTFTSGMPYTPAASSTANVRIDALGVFV